MPNLTSTHPRQTGPVDRVPLREKVALGLGFVTSMGSVDVIHVITSSVYNVMLGMSPVLVSVLLFIQRVWGALLDPAAGQFSDNFRSRFGRRRPLMALAVIPVALFFALIWFMPRGESGRSLFGYVLIVSLLFYTARSFYSIPLYGLQVEATADYHERTALTGFTQIFIRVFALVSNWLFPWVQGSMFPDAITGVHRMGLILGALFLVAGLVPVFLARERYYSQVARQQARAPLRENLRTILANRPLVLILGVQCAASFGYNVVGIFGMYTNYYYVYGGDIKRAAIMQGWAGSIFQVAAIGAIFLYRRLSRSIGKRRTLQVAASILMVGSAAKMALFQPNHPWLILVIWCANGAGMIGITVMALSMLPDVVDFEESRTGARREGLYASVLSLCSMFSYSVGALLSGPILVGLGFDAKLGGAQPEGTLLLIRALYAALPFAGALAAILIIRRYPLTETRAYEIKEELERRRKLAPNPA